MNAAVNDVMPERKRKFRFKSTGRIIISLCACLHCLLFVLGWVEILSFDKAEGFTGLKAPLGQSPEDLGWLHSCDPTEAVGKGRHIAKQSFPR